MGRKVGDTLDYTDENGRNFKVRIVAAVANSILQGSLVIDEASFLKRFPGEQGYRMLMIDAPVSDLTRVSQELTRGLEDVGAEFTPAVRRLEAFNAVQNTYLGTFQLLGGLGLLLGSAGLGIVVLRNVLERRGELAAMMAVGFTRRRLRSLVLVEHVILLGLGLVVGLLAATLAVVPAAVTRAVPIPWYYLYLTVITILINGLLFSWWATSRALRGDLLEALREE
jgi:ABC-type antimicrobial peptide transport system permease subunit